MKTALLALVSCVAFAQSPVFDVADVHVSKPGAMRQGGMIPGSGRLEFRGFSVPNLIQFAYGVDDDMIIGGPKWLGFDQFDVIAKGPRGSSDDAVKLMLRALLADRFKLVFHSEEKPMPAFALTVGKRVLLKQASDDEETTCDPKFDIPWVAFTCKNVTMASFAERVHQWAGGYLTHPVVDQTGLKGGYDFTLRWTGKGALATTPDGLSVFDAVQKELGLKLEEKKLPVPVMAIDSINEVPTPNAPGVKENLTVTATEFEAAELRPSPPGTKEDGGFKPGGRLDFRAMSVKDLLPFAYEVDDPNMIVGYPKWLETDKFDLVAKAPPDVSIDAIRVMLRSLFIERFKLETHKEERPLQVWVMTVSKRGSKLEKAEAGERQGCKPALVNDLITIACKATTLAQFGEQFHRFAGGYLDHPVVDETELAGEYNFTISWTPRNKLQGAGGRGGDAPPPPAAAAGGAPVASDPGGLSFFEAADRQLGLKFDSQKRPVKVIVIDHASPLVADQ